MSNGGQRWGNLWVQLRILDAINTDAKVRVDRRVARRPGQVLVFAVRNVLSGPGIAVFFREPEIDQVHDGT